MQPSDSLFDFVATVVKHDLNAYSNFEGTFSHYFKHFRELLPWDEPDSTHLQFDCADFQARTVLQTPYGSITVTQASVKLLDKAIMSEMSLQRLSMLQLMKHEILDLSTLLRLPKRSFIEFIVLNFSVYWIPMCHGVLHGENVHSYLPHTVSKYMKADLCTIFNFLTNPSIFDRMYRECRNVQLFVFSWLQYVHVFPSKGDIQDHLPTRLKNLDYPSRLPPHILAQVLLSTSEKLINRVKKEDSPTDIWTALLFCRNVATFLHTSSEYDHAYSTAMLGLALIKEHTNVASDDPEFRIWMFLKYEILCVLLQTMTSHAIYLKNPDPMFVCEVPNFLQELRDSGLLFHDSHPASTLPDADFIIASLHIFTTSPPESDMRTLDSSVSSQWGGPALNQNPIAVDQSASVNHDSVSETGLSVTPEDVLSSDNVTEGFLTLESYLDSQRQITTASLSNLSPEGPFISGVFLYTQLAFYHFSMCDFQSSYRFSLLALQQLQASLLATGYGGLCPSPSVVCDLLRLMVRLASIKRQYVLAEKLIEAVISYAKQSLGCDNPIFAHLLLEYGHLMLSTDKVHEAAKAYRAALAVILSTLPGANSVCALALDAIAYSSYVIEYTSGMFSYALTCADTAGRILQRLELSNSMQAASTNRIKALIIEEIAIDERDSIIGKTYLRSARDLHWESLRLCQRTYGLWNIQTAKHFGNLGRLYQSMHETREAELMHLKAIMIKEFLLGEWDYEVGVSVGHLASLYNYDMSRQHEAERLYLRSIDINTKLFGPTYSGLEYDYIGLQRVYRDLGDDDKVLYYRTLFEDWSRQRDLISAELSAPIVSESTGQNCTTPKQPIIGVAGLPRKTGQTYTPDWLLQLIRFYTDTFEPIYPSGISPTPEAERIDESSSCSSSGNRQVESDPNRSTGV